jgi:DNA-binding response OmpR family regulator
MSALLVDDDPSIVDFLVDNLEADRFSVQIATSGEQALDLVRRSRPDVALVDVNLPGISGYDVVSALREGHPDGIWDPGMAILLLSGRDDVHSVVRGIERGADDYVIKPFHYPELLARIGVHVRRARGVGLTATIHVGPLEVDRRAMLATVNGRALDLSAKEFTLLAVMARDPRRVLSKAELQNEVWGFGAAVRTRTVESHASRLRGKLARAGLEGWVSNLWGQGYRLFPEDQ